MNNEIRKNPSFKLSVAVMLICMSTIIVGVLILKLRAEVLLCIMTTFIAIISKKLGYTWYEMENAIGIKMGNSTPVILMILVVGMVVGTFMYSGSIPMIVYYVLKVINPNYVIISAFFTCCVFSMITGSSWSSAGTAGVVFMGIAQGLGVPLHITAGAIVSGSIFGDKMSPLSETTNLAPLCAGADLFDHIKSMFWTTIPATIIAVIVYLIAGSKVVVTGSGLPETTIQMLETLDGMYSWNILLLLPFIVVIYGAIKKKPTVPTLFISVLSALALGTLYQGFDLASGFKSAVSGFNLSMIYENEAIYEVSKLLNRGGMTSMTGIVLIIYCGYAFASILSKVGYLDIALAPITNRVKTKTQAVLAVLFAVFLIFVSVGNTYIAFILVPEIFRSKFIELRIAPKVMSRSLEDIGTVFGALLPYSGSAVFYCATLGVSLYGVNGYAPWAILSYIVPICAVICAITGLGVYSMSDQEYADAKFKLEEEKAV